jgi:hypothetical protein
VVVSGTSAVPLRIFLKEFWSPSTCGARFTTAMLVTLAVSSSPARTSTWRQVIGYIEYGGATEVLEPIHKV